MAKFGLITYILHKRKKGKFFSYSPYVFEMDLWFKYVEKILVAAPVNYGKTTPIESAFEKGDLKFFEIPSLNFTSAKQSLLSSIKIPFVIIGILKVMIKADHIHLRCPGNISLIGCFLQIFFPKKPKTVKYAGNWDPWANQPWSYRLQRKILSNTFFTKNAEVLVYGQWPKQTKNIRPFFTASFREIDKEENYKIFKRPFHFLFVGSLIPGKQPLFALKLVEALNIRKIPVEIHIYGDGALREQLKDFAVDKRYIHFYGNQPLEVLKRAYQKAHFIILTSKSEGWPKAIAEGMFFGCIPIATAVSCVPWMLGEGTRGILVPPAPETGIKNEEWLKRIEDRVMNLIDNPLKMRSMSLAAQQWSQQYTLEKFEEAIKEILTPNKLGKVNTPLPSGEAGVRDESTAINR